MSISVDFDKARFERFIYLIIIIALVVTLIFKWDCTKKEEFCEIPFDDTKTNTDTAEASGKSGDESEELNAVEELDIECREDRDCEELEICSSGYCVAVDCKEDSDCSENEECVDNYCEKLPEEEPEPDCVEDSDCGENAMCEEGICVIDEGEVIFTIEEIETFKEQVGPEFKGTVETIKVKVDNQMSSTYRLQDLNIYLYGDSDKSYKENSLVVSLDLKNIPTIFTAGNVREFEAPIDSHYMETLQEEKTLKAVFINRDTKEEIIILKKFRFD